MAKHGAETLEIHKSHILEALLEVAGREVLNLKTARELPISKELGLTEKDLGGFLRELVRQGKLEYNDREKEWVSVESSELSHDLYGKGGEDNDALLTRGEHAALNRAMEMSDAELGVENEISSQWKNDKLIEKSEKEMRASIMQAVKDRNYFHREKFRLRVGDSHESAVQNISVGLLNLMPNLRPDQHLGDDFIKRCVQDRIFMSGVFDAFDFTEDQKRLNMMLLFPSFQVQEVTASVSADNEPLLNAGEIAALRKAVDDDAARVAEAGEPVENGGGPVLESLKPEEVSAVRFKPTIEQFETMAKWVVESGDVSVKGMMEKFSLNQEDAAEALGLLQDVGIVSHDVKERRVVVDERRLDNILDKKRKEDKTPISSSGATVGAVAAGAALVGAAVGAVDETEAEGGDVAHVETPRVVRIRESANTQESGGEMGDDNRRKGGAGGRVVETPKDIAWLKTHLNVQAPKKIWVDRLFRNFMRWGVNTLDKLAPRALVNGVKGVENWAIGWLNQLPFVNIEKKKMEDDLVFPDVVKKK